MVLPSLSASAALTNSPIGGVAYEIIMPLGHVGKKKAKARRRRIRPAAPGVHCE